MVVDLEKPAEWPPLVPEHVLQRLKDMGVELDKRNRLADRLDKYFENKHPLSEALAEQAQASDGAYKLLATLAREPWAATIVQAVVDRVTLLDVRTTQDAATKAIRRAFKRNHLKAESNLTHESALVHARSFAIVWDEDGDDKADVTIESCRTTVVEYQPGSRFKKRAALRRWRDGDTWHAVVFEPDALYKFVGAEKAGDNPPSTWVPDRDALEEDGEWPLGNPLDRVPVTEFAVNRRLKAGKYGAAVGEFEPFLANIDRIHYITFCGLAGMTWAGFATLGLFGEDIEYEKDEDGNDDPSRPKAPFSYAPGAVIQVPNVESSLQKFEGSDTTIFDKHAGDAVGRLSAVSRTPAYKMSSGQLVNIGSEGMRVLDDAHIAKCDNHQTSLGAGWEDVADLVLRVEGFDDVDDLEPEAVWADLEMSTLAARIDALAKFVGSNLPWEVAAERILKMTPAEIEHVQGLIAAGQLTAQLTAPEPAPAAAAA